MLSNNHVNALNALLFLLRKWMHHGAKKTASLLAPPFLRRILNFLSKCVHQYKHHPQIVFQSVAAMCSTSRSAPLPFIHNACRHTISPALQNIAQASELHSMNTALHVVLQVYGKDWQSSSCFPALKVGIATICDRMAQLNQNNHSKQAFEHSSLLSPLRWAMLYQNLCMPSHDDHKVAEPWPPCPALNTGVSEFLRKYSQAGNAPCTQGQLPGSEEGQILHLCLQYLSKVSVPDVLNPLCAMAGKAALPTQWSARLLLAISQQICHRDETTLMDGEKEVENLLDILIRNPKDTASCPEALNALERFLRTEQSEIAMSISKRLRELEELRPVLMQNLSDCNKRKRLSSTILLSRLSHIRKCNIEADKLSSGDAENTVREDISNELRDTGDGHEPDSLRDEEMFDNMHDVMKTSYSMEEIAQKRHYIQEFVRLLRSPRRFERQTIHAMIHFSIGVLRTPLKIMWKDAGHLLQAAANREERLAMSVVMGHLQKCKDELLCTSRRKSLENKESSDKKYAESSSHDRNTRAQELPSYSKENTNGVDPLRKEENPGNSEMSAPNDLEVFLRNSEGAGKRLSALMWIPAMDEPGFEHQPEKEYHIRVITPSDFTEADDRGTTYTMVFFIELARILSLEPKHTLKHRTELISVYLSLDPSLFSQKIGVLVSSVFTTLLEKMGGLKCCESDRELELKMRTRLMSDLTISNPGLQVSVLRCLCVSRSPQIKLHRDSFIRLIESSTFREELTLLTERLFSEDAIMSESSGKPVEIERSSVDVITRICFAKLKGNHNRREGQRFAVLSFAASKLPSDIALPALTSLVLQPLKDSINLLMEDLNSGITYSLVPNGVVQKAVLGSIEAIVKQCRMSLPSRSWKQLTIGTLLILQNAGRGSFGQAIRSRSLRVFTEMHRSRPDETSFVFSHVIQAVKQAGFITEVDENRKDAPALVHYVGTVVELSKEVVTLELIPSHSWTLKHCFSIMKSSAASPEAVEVCLSVSRSFLVACSKAGEDGSSSETYSPIEKELTHLLASSIQSLVIRLLELSQDSRAAQKQWSKLYAKSLEVLQLLSGCPVIDSVMLATVADPLSSSLLSRNRFYLSPSTALGALSAIAIRAKEEGGEPQKAVQLSILRLLPCICDPKFFGDPLSFAGLCDLLSTTSLPDLTAACNILRSLNAMKSSRLDSPDLDKRLEAVNEIIRVVEHGLEQKHSNIKIAPDLKRTSPSSPFSDSYETLDCSLNSLVALFNGVFASVRIEDTAVRGSSGYAMLVMGRWAAQSTNAIAKKFKSHAFKALVVATVTSKRHDHRREYCRALGELVRNTSDLQPDEDWPGNAIFSFLRPLASTDDVNTDVFENLVHLQAHRRSKAIRDLEKSISLSETNDFPSVESMGVDAENFCTEFCLPLAINVASEAIESDEHPNMRRPHKRSQAKESAKRDVAVWAVSLAGRSAHLLSWENYKVCLSKILRRLRTEENEDVSQIYYKLLVLIANAFPQKDDCSEDDDEIISFLQESLMPRMLQHVTSGGIEGNLLNASVRPEVSARSHRSIAVFRAPVAIAVAQLMTRLPPQKLDSMISLLIIPLTNALRSRQMGMRDGAKKALTQVLLILGTKYLGYVLRQVLSGLTEGHRRDTCVYVIHSVLQGIFEQVSGSSFVFDDVYDLISEFLVEELKSGIDEKRKEYEDPNATQSRVRQSSIRAMKACECAELIAAHISFKQQSERFCKPYQALLDSSSSKLLNRTQELWRHLILGFSKNKSMIINDAFILCYKLVRGDEFKTEALGEDSVVQTPPTETSNTQQLAKCSNYRVCRVGLQFLSSILTKNWSSLRDKSEKSRHLQSMCEPFLPLVLEALEYGRDELTLAAFRVAQKLLKLPLRGRTKMGEKLSETIAEVLSQGSSVITSVGSIGTESDLFITCLRAAAVLLTEVGTKNFTVISQDRVEALIAVSCECIESGGLDSRAAGLSVLRALVSGQVILPSVYDAIEKVNQMAIHSQSKELRDSCTALSIIFLISFPLESRRVRQHLEFFVRNLSYDLAEGRLAALNAIHTMTSKFPGPVLERECEYLFLALTSVVSRDTESKCRANASKCLVLLFEKLPATRKVSDLLKMAATLTGVVSPDEVATSSSQRQEKTSPVLRRSGVASITAACMSNRLSYDQICMVARTAVTVCQDIVPGTDWETSYACLLCLEEAFTRSSQRNEKQLELQPFVMPLWKAMESLLLARHQWVRLAAARLLGRHLSSTGGRDVSSVHLSNPSSIWGTNELLRKVLKSSCLQLEANFVAPELAQQSLKNILCIADVLKRNPFLGDIRDDIAATEDVLEYDESNKTPPTGEGRALKWLIARMSGIAMKGSLKDAEILRRGCALRFLLVTSKWWGVEVISSHSRQYINPIMKVLESGDIRLLVDRIESTADSTPNRADAGPDLTSDHGLTGEGLLVLAQTLQEAVKEVLGTTKYFNIYQELQNKRDEFKEERKRQAAVTAAVDPERAAKKRRLKADVRRRKKRHASVRISSESDVANNYRRQLTEDM